MKRLLAAVMMWLACASPGYADVMGSGAGFSIPDNVAAGVNSTITFTENETITGNVVVTLSGLTHTWIGDLTATLIAPDLTSHNLFFRVGRVTTGAGDSSDLGGDYTFSDVALGDLWAVATLPANGTSFVIPGGSYRTTTADSAAFTTMDTVFTGKNTNGTWTLNMSDRAAADTGGITGWSLSMSAVPEPSSLTLIAMAGLAFAAKRRRKS